jgi:dienelactone hydrolase
MLFRRPSEAGPHPLLVFHHGSTGRGNNPRLFAQPWFPQDLGRIFAEAGWIVAVPQRRGRGGSGGSYAEGLASFGYSGEFVVAKSGYERAMADAIAAASWLVRRPEVDPQRVVLGGVSRGGILALGQAARQPELQTRAVVNFVGGWLIPRLAEGDSRERASPTRLRCDSRW